MEKSAHQSINIMTKIIELTEANETLRSKAEVNGRSYTRLEDDYNVAEKENMELREEMVKLRSQNMKLKHDIKKLNK